MDMEETRTYPQLEFFMRTLERPGLKSVAAGIVLQAYIPDSFAWQKTITEWVNRVRNGAAVTIRIVKVRIWR